MLSGVITLSNCFAYLLNSDSLLKEFATLNSKIFTFRVDSFYEGILCAGKRTWNLKVVFLEKMAKTLLSASNPLKSKKKEHRLKHCQRA